MRMFQAIQSKDGEDDHTEIVVVSGKTIWSLPWSKKAEKWVNREEGSQLQWGYNGSGPFGTAHSILAYLFDDKTADLYALAFESDVIAHLSYEGCHSNPYLAGIQWELTEITIQKWLLGHKLSFEHKG